MKPHLCTILVGLPDGNPRGEAFTEGRRDASYHKVEGTRPGEADQFISPVYHEGLSTIRDRQVNLIYTRGCSRLLGRQNIVHFYFFQQHVRSSLDVDFCRGEQGITWNVFLMH